MRLSADEIAATSVAILVAAGVPEEAAVTQTSVLVEADLRGRHSHGVQRIPVIVGRLEKDLAQADRPHTMDWVGPSLLRVDGNRGLGPVVGMEVMDVLCDRCREVGIAMGVLNNTSHLGMLAPYVERAARGGVASLAFTTSEALVHPWGGGEALVGTNPIAIGIPGEPHDVIVDLATSAISMGSVIDHAHRGALLPEGSAVGPDGMPTNDPNLARDGAVAPFGGAKGYALGLGIELLVSAVTGSLLGTDVKGTLDTDHPVTKGDVFICIDPTLASGLTDRAKATKYMTSYLDRIRDSAPGPSGEPVRIPGDSTRTTRAASLRNGIEIADDVWDELVQLRDQLLIAKQER